MQVFDDDGGPGDGAGIWFSGEDWERPCFRSRAKDVKQASRAAVARKPDFQ